MTDKRFYEMFPKILSYPVEGYRESVCKIRDEFSKADSHSTEFKQEYVRSIEQIDLFLEKTKELSLDDYEELYTRTFDINPVASLEIGWHIWGEAYERGVFLVTMRSILRKFEITESQELPDHLSHALAAAGKMEEAEANQFISTFLIKALGKILEGFKEKENPYEHILQALQYYVMVQYRQGVNVNG